MKFKSLGVGIFVLCTCAYVLVYTYTALAQTGIPGHIVISTWQIGQGAENSNTFITNSETECDIIAAITIGSYSYPDDGPDWNVTMTRLDGTHGFVFPDADDVARYQQTGTRGTHYPTRHGEFMSPLVVTMKATLTFGSYGSEPSPPEVPRGVSRTVIKTIAQDVKDQIRQEYVDHGISVPDREKFGRDHGDKYDNEDDYGYAIHEPARSNLAKWRAQFKRSTGLSRDIEISGGYRNPEHNWEHLRARGYKPSKTSNHQYGGAIDGAITDYDGDGETSDDRIEMHNAARLQNLRPLPANTYRSHIHIGG